MPIQQGPEPSPQFKVRVPLFSSVKELHAIAVPRVEEGVLIVQPDAQRLLWFPLGTIHGPVEIEAL